MFAVVAKDRFPDQIVRLDDFDVGGVDDVVGGNEREDAEDEVRVGGGNRDGVHGGAKGGGADRDGENPGIAERLAEDGFDDVSVADAEVAVVNEGAVLKDKPYTLMDIGIVALQFCLQATAEGLGTCIMGWFNEKKVKKLLDIPKSKRAELIVTLGYPSSQTLRPKVRKKMEEICCYNKYQ